MYSIADVRDQENEGFEIPQGEDNNSSTSEDEDSSSDEDINLD